MKASGRASTGVRRALWSRQSGGVREDIRFYACIVHQLHVGIAICHLENLHDPKTFRIIFANPAAEKYLSVPIETVYEKTIAEIIPKFMGTELPRIFQEVALGGEAKDLGEIRYSDEKVLDGIFAAQVFPLPDHCVCLAFEDLSEERKAARTISRVASRESEEGFRLLVEGVKDYAIFRLDLLGKVVSWNSGANRIKGYLKEEIIGKHFSVFYPPEDIASGKPEKALRIAEQEGRYEDEGWRVRKDGSRFWASVIITALRDETGQLRGFAKVTGDITERRELEKARLEAQTLQQRTTEVSLLSELGALLHACLTAAEAFSIFGQFAPRLFTGESGALYILSPSRNALESTSVWGDFPAGEQVFAPDDCWALRSGRMHYVEEPRSAVLCRHLSGCSKVAHVCVPMTAQGDTLGILHIHSNPVSREGTKEGIRPLSTSKRQLATAVAEQVGLALANLKLRETLRLQSVRDPLTGLFNRRFMQESLERELRRAARSNKPLGGILLDIDHFKQFNDSYGHEAGDIVLRELGGFLQSQIRNEDIACRVGGEEFLLILPDTSLDVTRQRAEKLREASKRVSVQYGGRPLGAIALSMGVVAFPVHGTTCEVILRSADEALYQAKAQGRDRVVVAKSIEGAA
jgi:diguanylate cyclase (GGDEF)-like protein/PAS domain S-box-containing protein